MTLRQVVSFALAAVYSGIWWLRWARDTVKNRMWGQLGWLSGLVCVGSVLGAVAWSADMQRKTLRFEGDLTINDRQRYTLFASAQRWLAAFNILNGLEFMCFMIPKLMMLDRLTHNATRSFQGQGGDGGWGAKGGVLTRLYRVVAACVVLCSFGGMVALYVAGANYLQSGGRYDQAAAACDAQGNDTNSSLSLLYEAEVLQTQAATAVSVQAILEAVALLLISTAYLILVPLSVSMFRRAERVGAHLLVTMSLRAEPIGIKAGKAAAIVDDLMHASVEQRRSLVIACVIVLISFPVRAAFDLLNAYALFDSPYNPACGYCGPCQTERFYIRWWLIYTPEIRPIIVALSSPLPLFVSLWIITRAHAQSYAISFNILRARLGRPFASPSLK